MSVTNLDFIKVGGIYPPANNVGLLAKYNRYDELFEGRIGDAYMRFVNDHQKDGPIQDAMKTIFSNPKIMNYPRAITKKIVDLTLSRQPSLQGSTNEKENDLIEISRSTKCWKTVRRGFVDISRYGNGYIREYNTVPRYDDGQGGLTKGDASCNAINPKMMTIVVNPLDKEDITNLVIGWVDRVTNTTTAGNGVVVENEEYYLTLEIHEKGQFEYKRFKCAAPIFNMGQVKQYVLQEEVTPENLKGVKHKTGLDGFAIRVLSGFTTSEEPIYGLSDYDMFDSLMLELCQRVSQLSEVFEKHGNPSMQGSSNLISTDENGNPLFYTGDFYPLGPNDQRLEYLTWDAKSKEILDYCNALLQQIFILSEMGDGSIMGYSNGKDGFAESGKGLRLKMASPLMKAQALVFDNNDEIIQMLVDFAKMKGIEMKPEDIEIKWKDGLPVDWVEECNMFNSRVQAGTESILYGLARRFGMSPSQAEDEWKQIIKEQKQLSESKSFAKMTMNNNPNNKQNDKMTNSNGQADDRETTEKKQDANNSGRIN